MRNLVVPVSLTQEVAAEASQPTRKPRESSYSRMATMCKELPNRLDVLSLTDWDDEIYREVNALVARVNHKIVETRGHKIQANAGVISSHLETSRQHKCKRIKGYHET